MTTVIVTMGHAGSSVILAAQLSFVIFVLREEFAFLFQTFSRNDPPGKAPPSRGRSVFKRKKRRREKKKRISGSTGRSSEGARLWRPQPTGASFLLAPALKTGPCALTPPRLRCPSGRRGGDPGDPASGSPNELLFRPRRVPSR